MVALTAKELLDAGNIPPQLVHDYSTAKALMELAAALSEENIDAQLLIKQIETQFPALLGVYNRALSNLEKERIKQLKDTS